MSKINSARICGPIYNHIICCYSFKTTVESTYCHVLVLVYLFPSLLIVNKIWKDQDIIIFPSSDIGATRMIQYIYTVLGISSAGIAVAAPWLVRNTKKNVEESNFPTDAALEIHGKIILEEYKDSMFIIGWCCIFSWCLLQLLLQQPVNSLPVSLLLVRILASIQCFSGGNPCLKEWVKVAALYYVGMSGHFGLGNTNSLATIDVVGAFIGVSSHSTVISGILMFMTHMRPQCSLLSLLMTFSTKEASAFANENGINCGDVLKKAIFYPCLIPLTLNSILLIVYTIILLLMRNHLFVWSVFSPKYLYVCATTVCVYVGVLIVTLTATYACMPLTRQIRRTIR